MTLDIGANRPSQNVGKQLPTYVTTQNSIEFKRGMFWDSLLLDTMQFIHSLVLGLEGQAWQEPEPSHVTSMALAHCILGTFLGVVCHCFPLPLDVPTLAARCLRLQRRERS